MLSLERRIYFESNNEKDFGSKRSSWRTDAIYRHEGVFKIAHAEETSGNEVIVNDGNYSINGTTYTYTGNFTALFRAGGTWGSEDANNNTLTFNGGTISDGSLVYIWAGYSSYGNVSGNTLNLYGGEFPVTNGFFGGGTHNGNNATNNTINIGTKIYFGDVEYRYQS